MQKRRYSGISPFTSEQKNIFFGRDNDIENLQNLISLRKQVLLYSKSGVGKTSLLNAGVLPRFEKKYRIIKIRFFSYDNKKSETPLDKIFNAIKIFFDNKDVPIRKDVPIDTPIQKNEKTTILNQIIQNTDYKKTLWYYFKQLQLITKNKQKYILVFDQFEELFSYPAEQVDEFKEQFYELTKTDFPDDIMSFMPDIQEDNDELDILYDSLKIKVVLAIRSDRLSLLNKLTDKLPDIQQIFYELQALNKEQTRQAIINPAKDKNNFETSPFDFEPQAIENIINALSNNQEQNIETTQLQIVCQKIENIANDLESSIKSSNKKDLEASLRPSSVTITTSHLPKFKDIFLNFYENAVKQTKQQKEAQKFIEDQLIRNKQRISGYPRKVGQLSDTFKSV